ncbi:MAG: DNA ligase [Desulfopila sp.]
MVNRPIRAGLCLVLLFFVLTVSEAAAAPALHHAERYTGEEEVTGWLMSEKLDGIRGYWNGRELLTRQGKKISAPAWFIAGFPPFALDGELWRGRNDFNFVQNTVLDQTPSASWQQISYNIFEVPEAAGDFPTRLQKARNWFASHPAPHVRIIEQIVCRGPDHLQHFLAQIEAGGGEGIIVKDPALPFRAGRRPDMLKVKNFRDMEGQVIAHNPGQGRFRELMGSLTLRLENGVEFKLGTGFTLTDRRQPPPLGSFVTFKYQGFTTNGIPRFASFLHVRKD